jgi:hypothetical protein
MSESCWRKKNRMKSQRTEKAKNLASSATYACTRNGAKNNDTRDRPFEFFRRQRS